MKDLLLDSFETFKLVQFNNNKLVRIIGGEPKLNFDKICREADGTTTHSMGWWDGDHENYYTDSCSD
ncbi:MAG: hypothetical protein IPO26_04570 [Saprospiraceae bacterium]|nr:hypothetical protein [Saprospiraceae bacterium]